VRPLFQTRSRRLGPAQRHRASCTMPILCRRVDIHLSLSIKNFSNIHLMIRGIPMSSHSTISSRFAQTGSRDVTLCRPLRRAHAVFAREAVTLTVQTLSDEEGNMPKRYIREWFGEERLPHEWSKPMISIGLWNTTRFSDWVGQLGEKKLTLTTEILNQATNRFAINVEQLT
jgi:hypothetical protein